MKSNCATWSIKTPVNLQAQDVWDAIKHNDDVEDRKDKMTLATINQVVSEDILLMLVEKDSAKAVLDTLQTIHVVWNMSRKQRCKS